MAGWLRQQMTHPTRISSHRRFEPLAPVAMAWGGSLVLVWLIVAFWLGQPLWQLQHSRDLAQFGATRGFDYGFADAWKLVASQWLHVKFPHMLFNAAIISIVGGAIERRYGWAILLCSGLAGGVLAQIATLIMRPEAYISGASQAYLSLCGLALVALPRQTLAWRVAVAGVSVSVILDLFVSSHGALKIGHSVGLGAGLIAGWLLLFCDRRKPTR